MLGPMRASRLVQLLLLLQARGRLTAAALAAELEVSERTIHRDVEALSAAGVPIYAERGPHGGIQLVEGYRTRLTGLTGDEAEALFLSGMPGPAAELGLGTVVAAARLKVLASLPAELRTRASRLVERFHLDAAGWFQASDDVPHLGVLAEAVWDARRVTIAYRRAGGEVDRIIDPLGLVLKAGIWYLVAAADDQVRTYRVSRFSRVAPTEAAFTRPAGFDLAAHWSATTADYEGSAPGVDLVIRLDPGARGMLEDAVGVRAVRAAEPLDDSGADGWLRLRLRVDWPEEVPGKMLALGDRVEVLEPTEVRADMVRLAERTIARHGAVS